MVAVSEIVDERAASVNSLKSSRSVHSNRIESKKVEQLEIVEPNNLEKNATVNTGYFFTKKLLLLLTVAIGTLYISTILATHFGTKSSFSSSCASSTYPPNPVTTTLAEKPVTSTSTIKPLPLINYRLPTHLLPLSYNLHIQAWIGPEELYADKAWSFKGRMYMKFTCMNATNKIVFHAMELVIDSNNLTLHSSLNTSEYLTFNKDIQYDEERQWFTIVTDKELVKGIQYTLTIPYSGKIIEKLVGFYRGSYLENGTRQ